MTLHGELHYLSQRLAWTHLDVLTSKQTTRLDGWSSRFLLDEPGNRSAEVGTFEDGDGGDGKIRPRSNNNRLISLIVIRKDPSN